ncbi:hypothetical protein D3727_004981 [Escherichia coli]|nr:hypothetical protein [Escherichia coli]EEX1663654.1 hypothetical protein [Escherichia coli]
MNTYEKIYQKLVEGSEEGSSIAFGEGLAEQLNPKRGPTIIKSGSHTEGLSIEELADKYNIDKEALERAILLSKSLKQGEV